MSKSTKLSASWQLNAALLSRPVDLTALVSMVCIFDTVYIVIYLYYSVDLYMYCNIIILYLDFI